MVHLLVAAFFVAASGCVQTPPAAVEMSEFTPTDPIVVALIDSGINPWHAAFAGASLVSTEQASRMGARTATEADDPAAREPRLLYAFGGTRVLGISFSASPTPVADESGHGTATASLIARDAPGAVIVMVQVGMSYCVERITECTVDMSVAEGMEWIAAQDWIDVVSISVGGLAHKPRFDAFEPEAERFIVASRAASDAGKLIVNSAGNVPTPSVTDYFSGAPWVVCVGAGNAAKHGDGAQNSKLVDVVANVTEVVADHETKDGTRVTSGTSFGTPIVAATLAEALRLMDHEGLSKPEARERLRHALNASAIRWSPTDWTPLAQQSPDLLYELGEASTPVIAGPAQIGWGHVNASLAPAIAEAAASGTYAAPPPEYALFMAQYQAAREDQWG